MQEYSETEIPKILRKTKNSQFIPFETSQFKWYYINIYGDEEGGKSNNLEKYEFTSAPSDQPGSTTQN